MTDDLDTWGRAQLDDDERAAIETGASDHPAWHVVVTDEPSSPTPVQAAHIERHGPWRVLREVDAKRRILDEHQDVNDGDCGTCVNGRWGYPTHGGSTPQPWPCPTVRLLFLPYADRDGYREEWRP